MVRGSGTLLVGAVICCAGLATALQEPPPVSSPPAAPREARLTGLPELPALPAEYDAPATKSHPESGTASVPVGFASVGGDGRVPALALAAYQRAATVIGLADSSCHLAWPL